MKFRYTKANVFATEGFTTSDADLAEAASVREGAGKKDSANSSALASLASVDIDNEVQKYVLIEARDPSSGDLTFPARGDVSVLTIN